jgi:hypothetical protein
MAKRKTRFFDCECGAQFDSPQGLASHKLRSTAHRRWAARINPVMPPPKAVSDEKPIEADIGLVDLFLDAQAKLLKDRDEALQRVQEIDRELEKLRQAASGPEVPILSAPVTQTARAH